jgi:DNA-directed RNA polymerases I, II, and III subunit RPABC4
MYSMVSLGDVPVATAFQSRWPRKILPDVFAPASPPPNLYRQHFLTNAPSPRIIYLNVRQNEPIRPFRVRSTQQHKIMVREGYQVPTGGSGAAGARGSTHQEIRAMTTYSCGDCGSSVTLAKDAVVACPHCAGRVLYKERTKR